MIPVNDSLISIDEIMTLVYKMVRLPLVTSFKRPTKDNFLVTNLCGISTRAYQESSVLGRMLIIECHGGDPATVKSIMDSFSHENALGKPFISGIDVKFEDGVCPQILRDKGHFVMSKNGRSEYHLHDLNGIPFWQHAINFKDLYGVPDNDQWEMTWYVNWVLNKQNILSN